MPLTPAFFRSSSFASDASFPSNASFTFCNRLPPAAPRRCTPVRRSENFQNSPMFHSRPLSNLTILSRSPTPSSASNRATSLPRRVFPQVGVAAELDDLQGRDEAPVVFDANLTFVLGCKGKLRENVKPIPAHLEAEMASNVLSNKIAAFLKKTDHVMDEWTRVGRKENSYSKYKERERRAGRSKSATNILIKGFQMYSRSSSRSSFTRELSECTEADAEQVENTMIFSNYRTSYKYSVCPIFTCRLF